MADITVNFADGTPHTYSNVPDSVTPDMIEQRAAQDFAGRKIVHLDRVASSQSPMIATAEKPTVLERLKSGLKSGATDIAAGALKGASNIGATIISPLDYAGVTGITPAQRREAITQALKGGTAVPGLPAADTESLAYKGGELASEIAGTAGIGGAMAKGVMGASKLAPELAPRVASALESGGFSTGAPAAKALSLEGAKNAAIRVGGGGVSGAAMAGMINPEDKWTGAEIGAAIPVIGKLAGESGRLLSQYAINPLFKPSRAAIEKLVQDAGGIDQAAAAIEKAKQAGKTLSGESYTLGQAGKNWGLAATERARSQVNPENFQQIYQTQRDARVKALQGVSQDDVALQNAIDTRATNAADAYMPMQDKVFIGGDDLTGLLARNRAMGTLQEAQALAAGRGKSFSIPVIEEAPSSAQAYLDEAPILRGAYKEGESAKPLEALHEVVGQAVKGGDLQSVKMGIDQALSTATGPRKAVLMQLKTDFLDWMGKQSPEYLAANAQYAADSRPINQMKVAQRLLDSLTGQAVKYGGSAKQQSEQFFRAMKNAPSIVKSETGMRQPLNKIFDEGQRETINQVARELAKDVDLQNLGRGINSDTAQKMARSNMLSSLTDLVNTSKVGRAAVNVATLGAKGRMTSQIDAMLQSPEYAGKALEELTGAQRNKLANLLANPAVRALPIAAQSK